MKVLLIVNKEWQTLDKRVKDLSTYLSRKDRLGSIYGEVKIDYAIVDFKPLTLGKSGMFSEAQVKSLTEPFRPKYDAIGVIHPMIKDAPYWGAYYPNQGKDYKMDFYVMTDEKTKVRRASGVFNNFERSIEHELAHAVSLDLGLKNQGQDKGYVAGADNTHYFFYDKYTSSIDQYYKEINELWKQKAGLWTQMLQASSKLLEALIGKKKIDSTVPVNDLLPEVKEKMEKMIQICDILGMPIRVTSGFRSIEEQNRLYAQGRTTAGAIVTNARGGESDHNFGKAFDIVFRKTGYEGDWEFVSKIGKQLGLKWGGDWKTFIDKPHFYID